MRIVDLGSISYCVGMQEALGDGSSPCRTAHAPITAFENQRLPQNRVCMGITGGGGADTRSWRGKKIWVRPGVDNADTL